MKNLEIIKKLRGATFTDEDGEEYDLDFQAGLTDSEVKDLSNLFPSNIIDIELVEILKETRGWEGYGLEQVDFSSIGQFGFLELSPNSITLGHDGFGNFWILDILDDGTLGQVYYACHDPAVFVKYSDTLNEFLNGLIEFYESPSENYLNEIHDKVVFDIWSSGGSIFEKEAFVLSNKEFNKFLSEFEGNEWVVADMRKAKNKDGFAWGKFGPNNLTKRHPNELIWVIKKKKKGFFARLFS
ncbi:MAG: SMI1/KNR4 family protein [Maribacter sp.]|uniref:SMI1/KNR4 family protein n=1 Tax=Maribacter sp. TaxID=1897614 RepID=UPI003299CF72